MQVEVNRALEGDLLRVIDLELAKCLSERGGVTSGDHLLLIAYLMAQTRQGHLCIHLDRDLDRAWDDFPGLKEAILRARRNLPDCLVEEESPGSVPCRALVRCGNRLYLQKQWLYELLFCQQLTRLTTKTPRLQVDTEALNDDLDEARASGLLLAEQAEAIAIAARSSLTFITGGPGTGKTYTAGHLLRLLMQHLKGGTQQIQLALAAPTGKAASQLQASLLRSVPAEVANKIPAARTLHSLLGVQPHKAQDAFEVVTPLAADLIVVDECSMIDAQVLGRLCSAVQGGARLILLGDKDQLPPVESGSLFADLTGFEAPRLTANCTAHLETCVRTKVPILRSFSLAVRDGRPDAALELVNKGAELQWHPLKAGRGCQSALHKEVLPAFAKRFPDQAELRLEPEQALNAFSRFRVLNPLRRGPMGAEAVNRWFYAYFAEAAGEAVRAVPILVSSNHSELELFNGEVGVLFCAGPQLGAGDSAIFRGVDGGVRQLPALTLPRFEYAYCLSVHKSQGSEYDTVALLLPEGTERFGRQVVYTAATRAKQRLELWGTEPTLRSTIQADFPRQSGVRERLSDPSVLASSRP